MDNYLRMFMDWTRDGVPAYPTWPERVHFLLRNDGLDELERRLRSWRFTEREVRSILEMRPIAIATSAQEFSARLCDVAAASPDRYPPVLWPRDPDRHRGRAREARYATFLKDKRVALVGPASSVVGSRRGATLEAYDVVVRLNFQWPVPSELGADIGERIDVLYHCCNGDLEIESLFRSELAKEARFVCWQFNPDSPKLAAYCQREGIPDLEISSVYEDLLRTIHAYPNTGTVAIEHLLRHDIEELFVTGISFYRDPYHDGYDARGRADYEAFRRGESPRIRIHEVAPQLAWFKRLCAGEPRLHLDERLSEIVSESGR